MTDPILPSSPNEELAGQVAAALVDALLIPETKQNELRDKLIQGTMRQEDWRLFVELALPTEEENGAEAD